jgi:hypothetical protein
MKKGSPQAPFRCLVSCSCLFRRLHAVEHLFKLLFLLCFTPEEERDDEPEEAEVDDIGAVLSSRLLQL